MKPFERQNKGLRSSSISPSKIKFNVDIKNELRKMNYIKNRLNNKMFHITEQVSKTYNENIRLQKKLDSIYTKGSGNYGPKNLKH